jgi:N4-gp56 family major capsid protein
MSSLDGYTDTTASSLGGTFGSAGLVQQAYDRLVEFELRAQPLLRTIVDKRPAQQAMPGSTVSLQIYKDLTRTTAELDEIDDPDAESVATPDIVNLVMKERGKVAMSTIRLGSLSLAPVDPALANLIAFNMADSIDKLVLDALLEGTNVRNAGGGVDATGTIEAADVRYVTAKLRGNKASGRKGSLYWAGIHPDVAHDLRAENSGNAEWRAPHSYVDTAGIYNGEVGTFEGAFFVESPRLEPVDGVYPTIFCGQQALAEAVAIEPHVVIGNIIDPLKRKMPIGWHGILGHAIYRDAALYRVESGSSIAEEV